MPNLIMYLFFECKMCDKLVFQKNYISLVYFHNFCKINAYFLFLHIITLITLHVTHLINI